MAKELEKWFAGTPSWLKGLLLIGAIFFLIGFLLILLTIVSMFGFPAF